MHFGRGDQVHLRRLCDTRFILPVNSDFGVNALMSNDGYTPVTVARAQRDTRDARVAAATLASIRVPGRPGRPLTASRAFS